MNLKDPSELDDEAQIALIDGEVERLALSKEFPWGSVDLEADGDHIDEALEQFSAAVRAAGRAFDVEDDRDPGELLGEFMDVEAVEE